MDRVAPGMGDKNDDPGLNLGSVTIADGYAVNTEPELVVDGEFIDPNMENTSLIMLVKGRSLTLHQRGDAAKELSRLIKKANKWDELQNNIARFYTPDREDEGDLSDIGEIAARAFGFL